MAVASNRSVNVVFSGDFTSSVPKSAAENASSPGQITQQALSSGANTITPPSTATACTILFPSGNTVLVTLKGIAADTGVALHLTDPTSFGINNAASTFVLNAASSVTVRLVWS